MNRFGLLSVIFTPIFFLTLGAVQLLGIHSSLAAVPENSVPDVPGSLAPAAPGTPGATSTTGVSSSAASGKSIGNLKTKKSTEVNFDDVLVQGKYHFSDEAVKTVEQDEILDALLGVQTDFKDRLNKSAARH